MKNLFISFATVLFCLFSFSGFSQEPMQDVLKRSGVSDFDRYYSEVKKDPCPPCPCVEKRAPKKMYSPNRSTQTAPPVVVNVYNSGNNCCCNQPQVPIMQQYYTPLNWYDNSGYWCFLLGTLLLGGLLGYMLGERNRNSGIGKESEKH